MKKAAASQNYGANGPMAIRVVTFKFLDRVHHVSLPAEKIKRSSGGWRNGLWQI